MKTHHVNTKGSSMKFNVRSPRSWVAALAMATLIPFAAPASAGLVNGSFNDSALAPAWGGGGAAVLVGAGGRSGSTSGSTNGNAVKFESLTTDGAIGGIFQSLTGLASGQYALKFWLKDMGVTTSGVTTSGLPPVGEFLVQQGSMPLLSLNDLAMGTLENSWTPYSVLLNVSADFTLLFTADTIGEEILDANENPTGEYSGSGRRFSFLLDDVTLTREDQPNGNVPEPGSLLLVGVALAGVAVARRRKMV